MLTLVDAIRFLTHALKSLIRHDFIGTLRLIQTSAISRKKKKSKKDKWYRLFLNAVSNNIVTKLATTNSNHEAGAKKHSRHNKRNINQLIVKRLHSFEICPKIIKTFFSYHEYESVKNT